MEAPMTEHQWAGRTGEKVSAPVSTAPLPEPNTVCPDCEVNIEDTGDWRPDPTSTSFVRVHSACLSRRSPPDWITVNPDQIKDVMPTPTNVGMTGAELDELMAGAEVFQKQQQELRIQLLKDTVESARNLISHAVHAAAEGDFDTTLNYTLAALDDVVKHLENRGIAF